VELNPALDAGEDASFDNLAHTLNQPIAVPLLILYLCSAYGKDWGKFWLIQKTSALRQKVLALLFPCGTWVLGLATYYFGGRNHVPTLGETWQMPNSLIELGGFSIIIVTNVAFVMLSRKKKSS